MTIRVSTQKPNIDAARVAALLRVANRNPAQDDEIGAKQRARVETRWLLWGVSQGTDVPAPRLD